jgi:hypothetical protein
VDFLGCFGLKRLRTSSRPIFSVLNERLISATSGRCAQGKVMKNGDLMGFKSVFNGI